jgi:hypothetical protein
MEGTTTPRLGRQDYHMISYLSKESRNGRAHSAWVSRSTPVFYLCKWNQIIPSYVKARKGSCKLAYHHLNLPKVGQSKQFGGKQASDHLSKTSATTFRGPPLRLAKLFALGATGGRDTRATSASQIAIQFSTGSQPFGSADCFRFEYGEMLAVKSSSYSML